MICAATGSPGKERDAETGLDYFGARYMSAAQGRFTSPDPSLDSGKLEDPQTWNRYAYFTNNPFRYVDPDGRQRADTQFEYEQREMLAGRMTRQQVWENQKARGLGALVGLGAVLAPEAVAWGQAAWTGLVGWALGNPDKVQRIAETTADVLAPPGMPSFAGQFERLGATTAASVEKKLSEYLLNSAHPRGADKTAWFKGALGFDQSNMQDLAKQVVFDAKTAVKTGVTEFGAKFNQTIAVTGANGKRINVVVAWIQNPDNVVRLVTAVPDK